MPTLTVRVYRPINGVLPSVSRPIVQLRPIGYKAHNFILLVDLYAKLSGTNTHLSIVFFIPMYISHVYLFL